uniref:Cytochrome b561 domain-containing protein n=1 Tax=Panagrolaimus sp. PS1159 TaxID=55785 RepID=A0AC35GLB2_9BILA
MTALINENVVKTSNSTEKPAAAVSGISPSTKSLLTKFHGIAFLFAWFFCVSTAVFSARYLRDLAPNVQPFGIRIWYHIHRTFNLIAAALMIIGLTTILIAHEWRWLGPKIGGGSKNTSATAYHSICGLLSVIIAWLQPFNALLRCAPSNPNRMYFNWFHRIFGGIGWVLAATAIVLACNNFGKHFTDSQAALSLVSSFLGFCGASIIVAEIFKIVNSRKFEDSNNNNSNVKQKRSVSFIICIIVATLIANSK